MLNRPNWLQEYPDLWEVLPAVEDGIPMGAARAALQRIIDVPEMATLLRPTLPPGHGARRLSWVCDLLRSAACTVDAPYAKWERARKARRDDATAFAEQQRERAKQQPQFCAPLLLAATEAEARDTLFNGPPPFGRPGPDLPQRRAVLMLCGIAQRPLRLSEPDLCRLLAAMVSAVFYPKEGAGDARQRAKALHKRAEWVRGIIRADRGRLRK